MTRITPEHLCRSAFVYVRQSTTDQVLNNHESRRRQYGLVERARALGWSAVEVIDDDLGRSGSGIARPGFEKLLAAICEGRVGAVVSIEASRSGTQRSRLAYAARLLWPGRHADPRRGRCLRPTPSQ
jgi:DNA invertase Pin-like site-specific DNA recombinase